MSFDPHYSKRKDRRRAYRDGDSRNFDRTCRNHGTCSVCHSNRTIQAQREQARIEAALKESKKP